VQAPPRECSGMGVHMKLGKPLVMEVHGSPDPVKYDDPNEVPFMFPQKLQSVELVS